MTGTMNKLKLAYVAVITTGLLAGGCVSKKELARELDAVRASMPKPESLVTKPVLVDPIQLKPDPAAGPFAVKLEQPVDVSLISSNPLAVGKWKWYSSLTATAALNVEITQVQGSWVKAKFGNKERMFEPARLGGAWERVP